MGTASGPLWLYGVDDQGLVTVKYDSATILHALLDDGLPIEMLLPRDCDVPSDFDTWDAPRRIAWICEHGQFDLLLPADPSRWRADLSDADSMPILVQRPACVIGEQVVVVYLNGDIAHPMPSIEEARRLVHATAGNAVPHWRSTADDRTQP